MASSKDHIMENQELNSEENILSRDQFESSAAPKLNDNACASAFDPGIDIKNSEFDVLLSYLSKTVIFENILEIYYFIKGPKDQIEFSVTNLYLEEFLVRIVRNVEVLSSKKFTLYCTLYCKFIIDSLKNALKNRIFMVACICKNKDQTSHQVRKNKTLIYKKLYYSSHYETQMQIFKGQVSIMSMSSTLPMSQPTTLDSSRTERSNFDAKQLNPFISHCLHLIFNFVKDQTQLTLNFSGLSSTDTVFLHSVFSSAINEKYDSGILCKKVHHAIWEAVKMCSSKFDYRIRNLRFSLSKKSLLLEKRLKRPAPTDATDEPSHNWQSKRSKKNQRNQAFVNQFSLEFINFCLKKMLEFLTEDSKTSLMVSVSTEEEKKFVKNIINYIRSPAVQGVFNDETRKIIKHLNSLLDKKENYTLKTSDKNKFGENSVKFTKVPKTPVNTTNQFQPPSSRTCDTGGPRHTWQSDQTQRNQEFVNQFSLKFLNFCLKKMLEFLTDETKTSLMVSVSTAEEKKFVKHIINYIRSSAVRSLFNDEPRRLIEQLNALLSKKKNYKLKSTAKNKFSNKNTVRFTKVPKTPVNTFQPPSSRTCMMGSTISATLGEDDSTHVDNTPRAVESVDNPSAEDSSAQQTGSNWYPRDETVPRNHGAIQRLYLRKRRRSMRKRKRTRYGWGQLNTPHINSSFQPAASVDLVESTDADPALNEAMRKHDISDTSDDLDHSFELIGDEVEDVTAQGQSSPIKIPTAMRMMVKMGWDGGALGATSSGILEPIMVSNDRNDDRRAGLGTTIRSNNTNTKSRKVTPIPIPCVTPRIVRMMTRMGYRPQDEFREIFLTHVLDFVSHNFEDMYIKLKPGINRLDLKFIINIIHNLAARTCNIKLEEQEQNLFDNILIVFEGEPDMYMTAFVPLHENDIHLKRITGQGKICHSIEARAKRFNDALLEGKELPTNVDTLMREYGPLACDEKTYFDKILKVDYLLEIYKLVKDEHLDLICFSRSMNWREKNMLRVGVMFINEKKCKYKQNTLEAVLFKLILQHMEGCQYELNVYECGSGFQISKVSQESRLTHADAINTDVLKNEDCLYDENYEEDEPDDNENDENQVENFESIQRIDGTEDEEIIGEETIHSETLNEGGSGDEVNDETGKKENNSAKIMKNVHLGKQTQAEKFDVKIVYVTINDLCSKDSAKFIQGIIAHDIEKSKELPYLVCHGVHNNAMVYSCHTKSSYAWLLQTCFDHSFAPSIKVVDKMSLKINCYYDMKKKDLFRQIEMYNNELSTKHWTVLKTGNIAGTKFFDVKMDQKSVNFILKSKMSLYAGIDTVTFSIIF